MPGRNDPVLDSGYPQVDHPGRPRGWFRRAWVWSVPLALAWFVLLWDGRSEYLQERVWAACGLTLLAMLSMVIWLWRTRSLSCPRCGLRISRVGADSEGAYYPCSWCRVMWRSSAERLPKVDVADLS
jgi:hypothetical protein